MGLWREVAFLGLGVVLAAGYGVAQQSSVEVDRTILPLQAPQPPVSDVLDIRDATPPRCSRSRRRRELPTS